MRESNPRLSGNRKPSRSLSMPDAVSTNVNKARNNTSAFRMW